MFNGNYVLPVYQGMKAHIVIFPLCAVMLFLTRAVLKRTPGYVKDGTVNDWCVLIAEILTVLLYVRFGWSVRTLQGMLLTAVFLYASLCDIRTRELADGISAMVFLIGLTGRDMSAMAMPLASALGAFAFFFFCAVLLRNRIGGADVKFIPAAFFVLGGERGLAGLILGLILSVTGTLIRNRIKKSKDRSLPMIPYLSAGFLSAFFI